HDDVGVGVLLERIEGVDVIGTGDEVTADYETGGETDVTQLVHHLVGQGAGLGHQTDPPGLGDGGGDDARVGLSGCDQPGTVRADDAGLVALVGGVGPEGGGVVHGDALGDDNGQTDLGVDRLHNGVLGELRWNEDHADVGAGGLHALGDGAEDGHLGAVEVDL